jgi:hypothetical protein
MEFLRPTTEAAVARPAAESAAVALPAQDIQEELLRHSRYEVARSKAPVPQLELF